MTQREFGIGMIGQGFMGKAHAAAYSELPIFFPECPRPRLAVICGRDAERLEAAATRFGAARTTTDWRSVVEDPAVDIVDICASGEVHAEIAIAAAEAGKHVLCEKPLALDLASARGMADAAAAAGVRTMVGFNYRFTPAVQLARNLVRDGRLGVIRHFRASFLQDWLVDPEFPLAWRMRKELAGSGALGDLAAHHVDMARFLVGEFESVVGVSETFVRDRPLPGTSTGLAGTAAGTGRGPVTVDDATAFLARLEGGVLGVFEVTRFATGHRSTNFFEVNGSLGSVRFDFERLNELEVYLAEDAPDVQGFHTVNVTTPAHPYGGRWWPGGHSIGYGQTFVAEFVELFTAISEGRQPEPDFRDGVRTQAVLDAVERSVVSGSWTSPASTS